MQKQLLQRIRHVPITMQHTTSAVTIAHGVGYSTHVHVRRPTAIQPLLSYCKGDKYLGNQVQIIGFVVCCMIVLNGYLYM